MDTQYAEKRNHDCHLEKICADYVDKYFFDRLPNYTYKRLDGDDEETIKRQLLGEDVVLCRNGKTLSRIDEKAKIYGLLNRVITYPSFEILCRTKNLDKHFESWFVANNTTTDYAMISIGTKKPVVPGSEWQLGFEDISRMVYGLIDRHRLHAWVEQETGKTMKQITADAWDLLNNYQNKSFPQPFDTVKVYKSDIRGKYLYLKLSDRKKELPVNLVIRRDRLRNYGLIAEFYIDNQKVKKYDPPETFMAEERIYAQEI